MFDRVNLSYELNLFQTLAHRYCYFSMKYKHRLSLGQTLIICGIGCALYLIFRSPELDQEIRKFEKQNDLT
jgi:hypothetical protein